jgi:iron complex transport system permease protein
MTARRLSRRTTLAGGVGLLALSLVVGAASGAYAISLSQLLGVLGTMWLPSAPPSPEYLVFVNIRLPRLILGMAAGAGLGMAGTLMQGLFRNPLADPGLIGISSGAALAAGVTIVLGAWLLPVLPRTLGSWTLVTMAFGGGFLVTLLIFGLSQSEGGTRMALMLLAGIAINALAGAGLGFLSVMATDEQLRSLQFWLLGSLGAPAGARSCWSAASCWLLSVQV